MKELLKAIKIFLNLIISLSLSAVIIYLYWVIAGKDYLLSKFPMGGDYFNALTYVNFYYNHLPLPPAGWLPFWNEGSPIIGGYPWLAFYLMKPLMNFFDPASTMEIFASASLVLFFVASFLLFRVVSKNWLIAFTLTLILLATRATYYPLMTGGFVISATTQWYLPVILFFIYKFQEKANTRYLILASILGGLSLLQHAPTSLLMIFIPAIVALITLSDNKTVKKKALDTSLFVIVCCAIGLSGLYTVILQTVLGSGTDNCLSPQCWGIYPKHLIVWMTPLTPLIVAAFLMLALLTKLFKRSLKLFSFIPAFSGFTVLFLYVLFAHLKLIDGLANVLFPTRVFWAANLFLLLIAAHLFQSLGKALPKVSLLISLVITVAIGYSIFMYPPTIHKEFIATDPIDSYKYTIAKYKTRNLNKLVPSWIPLNETNWRLDTFNPGLTHWWNFASYMPSTRGYSDHPLGVHRDWQYFLQFATRDPQGENQELIKNRALFLLDAFGVGYHEDSVAPYPKSILTDSQIIVNAERKRDFTWYQLSPNYVSPIVSPTNSNAVLFVGDEKGYENLIRTMAMTNLNSFLMIPVKGEKNIDSVNSEELKQFKAVILYRFKGENWSKITSYVKNGGMVFIETGTQDNLTTGKLQEVFPIDSVNTITIQGPLDATLQKESNVDYTIKTENFSPFIFENGPWKLSTSSLQNIRSWAQPILSRQNQALLVHGMLGKGRVVWSGMNLIYHIVTYDNYEEAKLFANILKQIAIQDPTKPTFTVQRDDPRIINITGNSFNGIYFKENYDSGWTAEENGKKLKVYKAGLDFMYIAIPQAKHSQIITLYYNGSFVNWLLFIVSISSLILALLYTIIPHPFHALHKYTHHHIKHKVVKKVHAWWQKEEEE